MRSHIKVTLAEGGRADAEAVRGVLTAVGSPAEIVAAAMPGETGPATVSRGITGLEITTLVLSADPRASTASTILVTGATGRCSRRRGRHVRPEFYKSSQIRAVRLHVVVWSHSGCFPAAL